jgi:VDE lipocalin domain
MIRKNTKDIVVLLKIALISQIFQFSQPFVPFVVDRNKKWSRKMLTSATTKTPRTTTSFLSSTTTTYIPQMDSIDNTVDQNYNSAVATVAFLLSSNEQDYSTTTTTTTTTATTSTAKSKFGSSSPYGNPSIIDAVQHLSEKIYVWSNGTVQSTVISIDDKLRQQDPNTIRQYLTEVDVLVAIGINLDIDIEFVSSIFTERFNRPNSKRARQCQFILDSCTKTIPTFTSTYDITIPSIVSKIIPWTKLASAQRLQEQMTNLYSRWTSDDFCYATLLFINQFSGSNIDWVKHSIDATWEKGPVRNIQELYNMVDKCGDCITNCVKDDSCRACITKLTEIDSRDQVANYRTLVSFESDLLEKFSLCILTRNNIFGCDATIPSLPKVYPTKTFRNKPVTEEVARSLLIGHLDEKEAFSGTLQQNVSWIVACGANAAYDQFPSQNQVFYPASRGRDMWYDPVFRVNTLDGRSVWCKRHYKVRPQKDPGTFRFSVLDNGVTSDEFWTIIAVADDLSWIVFHYAGAASSVGLQYLGGLLCTPDGKLPTDAKDLDIIWDHFRSAGIQPWELYNVDNSLNTPEAIKAGLPPLDYYRKKSIDIAPNKIPSQ